MSVESTYCVNHPDRETGLRCKTCNDLICVSCAQLTPTGYQCPNCKKDHGKKFDTSEMQDYIIALPVAFILANIGTLLARSFGFFILFVAPFAGIIIAEAVRAITKKRRSSKLFNYVQWAIYIGGGLRILPSLLFSLFGGNFMGLISVLFPVIFLVICARTAYSRLSGIQVR